MHGVESITHMHACIFALGAVENIQQADGALSLFTGCVHAVDMYKDLSTLWHYA